MSRWYASRAAAERGDYCGAYTRTLTGAGTCLFLVGASDRRQIDVSGRSARHIDRLARDWIGHGVAPCADGSRGVGRRILVLPGFVPWVRARSRARRVVRVP